MQPLTHSLIDCGSWWTGLFADKDSIGAPNEPLKSTRQPPQTLYAHLSCIRAQVGSCWLRLKLESAKEKEVRHWWRHSCSCCRRHPYGRFCRSCRHCNRCCHCNRCRCCCRHHRICCGCCHKNGWCLQLVLGKNWNSFVERWNLKQNLERVIVVIKKSQRCSVTLKTFQQLKTLYFSSSQM